MSAIEFSAPTGVALHRRLDRIRARESLIVPVTERAAGDAIIWNDLYDSEPKWMEWGFGTARDENAR
jgi:hypothetical protein